LKKHYLTNFCNPGIEMRPTPGKLAADEGLGCAEQSHLIGTGRQTIRLPVHPLMWHEQTDESVSAPIGLQSSTTTSIMHS